MVVVVEVAREDRNAEFCAIHDGGISLTFGAKPALDWKGGSVSWQMEGD